MRKGNAMMGYKEIERRKDIEELKDMGKVLAVVLGAYVVAKTMIWFVTLQL